MANGRRRSRLGNLQPVVGQITQIVAANEALQREVRDLTVERDHLRSQLREIGEALGRLTGGARRGRGGNVAALPTAEARRQRKPITDPEQLERRRQALAKARAARAEKLAAARASGAGSSQS